MAKGKKSAGSVAGLQKKKAAYRKTLNDIKRAKRERARAAKLKREVDSLAKQVTTARKGSGTRRKKR